MVTFVCMPRSGFNVDEYRVPDAFLPTFYVFRAIADDAVGSQSS